MVVRLDGHLLCSGNVGKGINLGALVEVSINLDVVDVTTELLFSKHSRGIGNLMM